MNIVWAMITGFLLDCILGDPHGLPHPIRWIGRLISMLDKRLNGQERTRARGDEGRGERSCKGRGLAGGAVLLLAVLAAVGCAVFLFRLCAYGIGEKVGILGDSLLFYYCIAPRSLCRESMAVCRALEERPAGRDGADGLWEARKRLSMIVGRDTEGLTEEGIIKAAVETVAENTSDGVTAPMFYMALGGPLLCFLYKAVNTMDSMVGYHNDTYEYFGRAAARTDDLWNYIPSRLTAYIMLLGAMLASPFWPYADWRRGLRIYRRDRGKHKSPNAAQTESVCAGVLGIRLAGDARYFGRTVHKPYIGDNCRPAEREDIPRANRLMYVCSLITLLVLAGVRAWAVWKYGI